MKNLYGLDKPYIKKDGNRFDIIYNSRNLINFKLNIGIQLSPKRNIIIPEWIKNNKLFLSAFLRGIFDTDGCLSFKSKNGNPHNYPIISISLKDKCLIYELVKSLTLFDVTLNKFKEKTFDKRYNKKYTKYGINISGRNNLNIFLKEIKFNNWKHISKYLIWQKFGLCPPKKLEKNRPSWE